MKEFIVTSAGYSVGPCFDAYPKAKRFLTQLVKDEAKRCKGRFGSAHVHKNGEDAYHVTLGSDRRSSLWSSHAILSF